MDANALQCQRELAQTYRLAQRLFKNVNLKKKHTNFVRILNRIITNSLTMPTGCTLCAPAQSIRKNINQSEKYLTCPE